MNMLNIHLCLKKKKLLKVQTGANKNTFRCDNGVEKVSTDL